MHHLLSSIEFQMSLLLFVALAGYILASKINQSAVIGEILVGLIIGPSLLGWITYTDFVKSIAHLGAVILLFVVGLEFRLRDIANAKYGVIALAGVIVPWICGYYLAKIFGYDFNSAIMTGTALTATSIAITANVLKEMGMLQTDAARAIIGAAVIDDVLSLVALSISNSLVEGTFSMGATILIIVKAAAFLTIGSFIGIRFLSKGIRKLDDSDIARMYPEFAFIFAMMLAFLYAMAAEAIGLSAIVGSFLAGVSLGHVELRQSKDYKEGAEYLHIIFAAIFFVSLGIIADFNAITKDVMLFLAVLTVVAVLTKVIGCALPAYIQKMSVSDSMVIGIGMVPRGEVAMIVALIGLNKGLIGQDIYVTLVLMSLLTTMLTPILLRGIIGNGKRAENEVKGLL